MCMLPFVSFVLLHILNHASCYFLSPSAFLFSYYNRNDVTLLVAPEEEEKLNSKSIVSTASSCLHVWSLSVSLYVCLWLAVHLTILTPLWLPQSSVSVGRKEGLVVTVEMVCRKGGRKSCCFPLLWSLSQKLQTQVCVCIWRFAGTYGCAPESSLKWKLVVALFLFYQKYFEDYVSSWELEVDGKNSVLQRKSEKKWPPFNICPAPGCNLNGSRCWEWARCQRVIKGKLKNIDDHPLGKTTNLICRSSGAGILLRECIYWQTSMFLLKNNFVCKWKSCVSCNARSLTFNIHFQSLKARAKIFPHVWKSSTGCQLQLRVNS